MDEERVRLRDIGLVGPRLDGLRWRLPGHTDLLGRMSEPGHPSTPA